ncbi:unnamed protein product [Cuscuta campestris]|uniref:DUF4219 domain-containing protein n=1 Tax=Cuscuta campestris TaxID=132261 RepID=A0A484N265_9ASTE|nr:unnamed protein product [Cuscuta campestris]
MKKIGDTLIPKDEDEYDEADFKNAQLNSTAINFLYCAVNANDYQKISRCQTANQMWNKLMITYEGTPQVRDTKIDLLTHEYELFSMKENELVEDMFGRFSNIVNDLDMLGKTLTDKELVRKILRSLTKEWESKNELVEDMFGRFSNIVNDLDMLGKTLTDKELVRKILRSLTKEWESKVNSIYEGRDYNVITYDDLLGIREGQSTVRPPFFDGTNYSYWKERMRIFIQSNDFKIWHAIKNGDSLPIKKIGDTLIPKDEDEYDEADFKKAQLNATAINFSYCAVNANDYQKISHCQTANQMWNKLMITYEVTPQVRESKIDLLTHEYELFAMKENELVEDMFGRFSNIVHDLDMLGKTLTDKELVRKILRSLTKEWKSKVNSIYEGRYYNVITYDGLRGTKPRRPSPSVQIGTLELLRPTRFCHVSFLDFNLAQASNFKRPTWPSTQVGRLEALVRWASRLFRDFGPISLCFGPEHCF